MIKAKLLITLFVSWMAVFGVVAVSAKSGKIENNEYRIPFSQIIPPLEKIIPGLKANPNQSSDPELMDVQVPIAKENRKYNDSRDRG